MDSSDDELLFGDGESHDSLELSVADNNDSQLQQNNGIQSSKRKRLRAHGPGHDLTLPHPTPGPTVASASRSVSYALEIPPGTRDRQWIIDRIEDVFEQQVDGIIANNGHLVVAVKLRPHAKGTQSPKVRQFRFPGKSEKDAWRYTVIIRILELVYEALMTETTITKRDIYYRDPALFSKQAVVDRFVDDLAYTFGASRLLLNVTATAKGLIAGNFAIQRIDGAVTDGRYEREGVLISPLKDNERVHVDHVRWVLVVEKEAAFRSLVSSSFWERLSSHGLLVTGKGYPDIATRLLLRSIATPTKQNNFRRPPVYTLMDYDPDGMDILKTYKHGSAALAHESAELALPSVQWIGLSSNDLGQQEDLHQSQGLLKLSGRDRRKATRMLEREPFIEKEPEWRRELQAMLFLNVKAEIQLLEAQEGRIARWLASKRLV